MQEQQKVLSSGPAGRFPFQLHLILIDAEKQGNESIIAWNKDGRSFKILDRDRFESELSK